MPAGFVYILASRRNGTLYTGVTSDLLSRIDQHRRGEGSTFAQKYGAARLVYFERHDDIRDALVREKQIKRWRRKWKLSLIERDNSGWNDLYNWIGPETL